MNHIGKYVIGVVLSLMMPAANSAVVVDLTPNFSIAAPGDSPYFDLSVDFGSKVVVGGAIDMLFSSTVFSYNPDHFFDFDAGFIHDGGSFEQKNASAGMITIGFSNAFAGGFTGPYKVGRLFLDVKLDALQSHPEGLSTQITMRDSDSDNLGLGGFVDFNFEHVPVDRYDPATVTVQVSAVPLPPTAWLFASGLVMLGALRLQRRVGSAESGAGSTFA